MAEEQAGFRPSRGTIEQYPYNTYKRRYLLFNEYNVEESNVTRIVFSKNYNEGISLLIDITMFQDQTTILV